MNVLSFWVASHLQLSLFTGISSLSPSRLILPLHYSSLLQPPLRFHPPYFPLLLYPTDSVSYIQIDDELPSDELAMHAICDADYFPPRYQLAERHIYSLRQIPAGLWS